MNSDNVLTFPVSFVMKIIMNAESSPGDNRRRLEAVFNDMGIPADGWGFKTSGQGRFASYSVSVTVRDRPEFELLHARIAGVGGVRYVL